MITFSKPLNDIPHIKREESTACSSTINEQDAFNVPLVGPDKSATDESAKERMELATLELILSKRDAIMESKVVTHTKRLRELTEEEPEATIKRLSTSYLGYASMTNIVCEWLVLAKHLKSEEEVLGQQSVKTNNYQNLKEQVESEVTREVAGIIKQKFNKNVADELMAQLQENPSWLLEMMRDETFRRTLIELYDMHSSSALLGYCIRKISEMGHNREIAQLIRESPYLSVFNSMLIDLLNRVSFAFLKS